MAKTKSTPPADEPRKPLLKLEYEGETYFFDPASVRISEATFVETIAGQSWAQVLTAYDDDSIRAAPLVALAAVIIGRSDSRRVGELYDEIAQGALGDLTFQIVFDEEGPTQEADASPQPSPKPSPRTASATAGSTN